MKTFEEYLAEAQNDGHSTFISTKEVDHDTANVVKEFVNHFQHMGWKLRKTSSFGGTVTKYKFDDPKSGDIVSLNTIKEHNSNYWAVSSLETDNKAKRFPTELFTWTKYTKRGEYFSEKGHQQLVKDVLAWIKNYN